ncbi:Phytochrome-associated serine/threonine-protein phosphatase [Vitis vinifera]|uniref:Phytochrome-associated serine/threonine-protein phosphatase n=1 Tax=Vitis vinifera TaxID=29760 RepID=A0A438EUC6_VITVI|nr:Phytochrome-associated serine/threonine-protein phosphatase [Vitis vinifera]
MDLDQWISKVKEGQHLLEDELQLLCEYVRFLVVELVHFAFNLVGKRMDSLNLEASLMSKFGFRCFGERRSACAS